MKKEEFWTKQYRDHIGKMVGVCYRYVSDWQVAEDLAQDAFLKAMEKGRSFHGWGNFEGWLKKIAVNEALMYLRNRLETETVDENMAMPDETPEELPVGQTDFSQEELLEAMGRLPARQRAVFNLYAVEHLPHNQIAETLNISVTNSKVLLSRARNELQGILSAIARKKMKSQNK
ncbi:MAG: RNA polymerase sigma factor [Bacteroidales bacterium]|nr:RNA polymerase sigma factor [Bacteroidales bacterium]